MSFRVRFRHLFLTAVALIAPVPVFAQESTGSTVLGPDAVATADYATAVGQAAAATASFSSSFGQNAQAKEYGSTAVGSSAVATGYKSLALGTGAIADASACVAIGTSSGCGGRDNTLAVGNAGLGLYRQITGVADGQQSSDAVTVGQLARATGGTFVGGRYIAPTYNLSTGSYTDVGSALTALDSKPSGGATPWMSSSEADPAIAKGDAPLGRGNNLAVGSGAGAGSGLNQHNLAIGGNAQAGLTGDITDGTGGQATAVGANSQATNLSSTALGYGAVSSGRYSTAIGAFAVADEDRTVSFGRKGDPGFLDNTSRLVYVSDGINPTDAMNMRQGAQIASWYGGGVDYFNAIGPTFALSGGTFSDVNSALLFLDGKNAGGGGAGPQGPKGDTGPQGTAGTGSGRDDLAVHYDDASQASVTLGGTGGTAIHNVRAGTAETDAVNVDQLNRSAKNTLNQANAYSDSGDAQTRDWAKVYTDSQIRPLNRRISQAGAVGSVFGSMALSSSGIDQTDRIAMGVASYRGESAVGVAMVHRFENSRVAMSVGGAFAGSGSALAVSVSIGLGQ